MLKGTRLTRQQGNVAKAIVECRPPAGFAAMPAFPVVWPSPVREAVRQLRLYP